MQQEDSKTRSERILNSLKEKYPGKKAFDLDGRGLHFVCEVEPTQDHPEYDVAMEVIISSKPHKHHVMTQYYRIISGTLKLFLNNKKITLHKDDTYIIQPNTIHYATSNDECWVEITSKPGWTKEDHIVFE